MARPGVHPCCLVVVLLLRHHRVGDDNLCTQGQEQCANDTFQGRAVNDNTSIEVPQDHKLVRVKSGLDESVELLGLICVSPSWCL